MTHLRHLGSKHKQYARSPRGQQQQQTQMSQCIKRRIGFIPEVCRFTISPLIFQLSLYRNITGTKVLSSSKLRSLHFQSTEPYIAETRLYLPREKTNKDPSRILGVHSHAQHTTLTPSATHTCKQMYTILAAAKLAVFHLEQNGTASTAVVKKDDPYRVSASFLVTLILPFLTLLYLEMARSQTNAVPAPISLKTFPTLNCAGHSGDEPSVKLPHESDEKVHAYRKKVTWVASSPQLMSRTNLCDISQLQILIPAPPARTIRRTSNNPARASFTKQSNDTILCPEECVVHLVEETLAYFKLHKPLTQELRLLIPKLEQFAAWNERNFKHSIQ